MKSINKFVFVFSCMLLSATVFGQQFSITGKIYDEASQPIAYANIILLKTQDSTIVTGTTSDDFGEFTTNEIASGNYILKVSFIGFEDFLQQVSVENDIELQTIVLKEAAESLSEIELVYKKPTLKKEADRLIFNVENTALTEGTILQVLKSTPSVLVMGDEIKVKNSNPTVYINNRKVYLSSQDLNQLLEGSSANAIKSIEVITNPSARYDAESGIVLNIVMSKNLITGYRGSIYTNYTQGVFPRYNTGTSHFFKNKTISFNINYNYDKSKINRNGDDIVNYIDNAGAVDQSWRSFTNRNIWSETHNINTNFDYFIDDNNTVSLSSYALYLPYFKYRIANNTIISDNNGVFLSRFTSDNLSRDNKYNLGFDLGFNHSFTNGELAFNTHFTRFNYERNQGVISDFYDINNAFQNSSAFNTNNNQDTRILVSKLDYSLPLSETSNFEAGVKFSNITTESDITQFDVDISTGNETIDMQNSDVFNYDERIYAAYVNYSSSKEKYSLNVGLRTEKTNLEGRSPLTNTTNTQDYLELFPNLSFQYNFSDSYNVYVNYKRSIARPVYTNLNPFRFFLNENYVVVGNPRLTPTFLDHYVVGTTLFDNFITFEAYYQNYKGQISEIPRQNNDTNIIEYINVNVGKTIEYGFDFLIDYNVTEDWNASLVTSFYNIEEETNFGNGFVNQNQWSNYSYLNNDITFLKDKSLNIFLSFVWVGKNLQAFQTVEDRLFSNLAISKTVFKKKGIISLSVNDLFNMHNFDVSTQYQNQFNTQVIDIDDRYVRLGFRYKFGNTRLETNERTKSSEERDRLKKKNN